jgi:uncharacterized LabA/DUF88 family protein
MRFSSHPKIFAYIDGTNLHLSAMNMGWRLDYRRFRVLLSEKYHVQKAYYFLGYVEKYRDLYYSLQDAGYLVVNIEPTVLPDGRVKGNCDADLVCQAMADVGDYDKAIIVASDGDYRSLVLYLKSKDKLDRVIGCSRDGCASKLTRAAGANIDFLDDLKTKVEYKKRETL